MQIFPDKQTFVTKYNKGLSQVVWTNCIADLETPVSAMMKIVKGEPNSFLLESVEGGSIRGRYSFIGLNPDIIWRCSNDTAEINREASSNPDAFLPCPISEKFGVLKSLREFREESRIKMPPGMPPMASGLVGYMAYDMVRLREKIPDKNPDVLGLPDSIFVRPTIMAVFDSLEDTITIVTPVWCNVSITAEDAFSDAKFRISGVVSDLKSPMPLQLEATQRESEVLKPKSNMTHEYFLKMIKKAIEYICAGDAFQIVPSQRFSLQFLLSPLAYYRALRRLNPSPFLFFLNFGDFSIVGSSPEILVRVRNGQITLRPLAGTRKRGRSPEEDSILAEELLSDPKELAEHLMLLDLGRNDVGRVAKIGTVKPTEKFTIEYYSHVMHIASNVEGELNTELFDPIDALFSGFPAGTVSGAPKVRAMEIIEELESEKRGVYGGCIGYFGADGDMDTCIALRTAIIKEGILYVQAGCGVVADSDPESEYQETIDKSQALIKAAEEATQF